VRPNETQKLTPPRATTRINSKLDKNLAAYTAAAGAASVALLAASQPAQARVVYTPVNTVVSYNNPALIDLNNDGTPDFSVGLVSGEHSSFLFAQPKVTGNAIRVGNGGAPAGFFGVPVGQGEKFATSAYGGFMAGAGTYGNSAFFDGPWAGVTNRYLGVKFSIAGQVHYGWVRLSVANWRHGGQIIVTGYAYETIANENIIEGHVAGPSAATVVPTALQDRSQPATLGMLAGGADGLAIWRRTEDNATQNL
jgi:hypothetical protein